MPSKASLLDNLVPFGRSHGNLEAGKDVENNLSLFKQYIVPLAFINPDEYSNDDPDVITTILLDISRDDVRKKLAHINDGEELAFDILQLTNQLAEAQNELANIAHRVNRVMALLMLFLACYIYNKVASEQAVIFLLFGLVAMFWQFVKFVNMTTPVILAMKFSELQNHFLKKQSQRGHHSVDDINNRLNEIATELADYVKIERQRHTVTLRDCISHLLEDVRFIVMSVFKNPQRLSSGQIVEIPDAESNEK